MALRYAVANGNWSAPATWDGGTLPGVGDDVYANGKTVTIDQDVTVLSVQTTAGAPALAGGNFVLPAGRTFVGNVICGSTNCVTFSGAGSATIIGNIFGSNTAGAASGTGVTHTGPGTLNVVGNLYGGSSSTVCFGVWLVSSGILNVTGDVIGGSHPSGYCCGAYTSSALAINVYGTCIGGTGGALSAAVNLSAGNLFAQVVKANNYPNDALVTPVPAIDSTSPFAPVIDAMEYGSGGVAPVKSTRLFVRDGGTNFCKMRQSNAGSITVMGEVANDYPAQANVRTGVVYDFGAKVGTCAVPPAGSVALGVPVDAATGTAALSPADVWAFATRSLTEAPDVPTPSEVAAQVRVELATELARLDQAVSAPKTLTGAYDAAKSAASAADLAAAVSFILANVPEGLTAAEVWAYATRSLTQDVGLSPDLTARLENCATVQTVGDQLAALGV